MKEVEVRIALAELVCYVGYAAAVCDGWGGEIVAYATDNMNVRVWLATRRARTPMARHLIRILGMLETRYRFRTLAFYIRTYHNVTADWVSRESKEVVEGELMAQGWQKVSPAEDEECGPATKEEQRCAFEEPARRARYPATHRLRQRGASLR